MQGKEEIKGNLTKFLVNNKGEVVDCFEPHESPESFENRIKLELGVEKPIKKLK